MILDWWPMKTNENVISDPSVSTQTTGIFSEIVGQRTIVQRLAQLVELHKQRGEVLRHILLIGPEGSGKRTIAHVMAREYGASLRELQTSAIERAIDLVTVISGLEEGDFLLFDASRIRRALVEMLAKAMKEFEINVIVGKGTGARSMPLAVKPFTCLGISERLSDCDNDLVKSFDIVMSLQPYTEPEMLTIAERLASGVGIRIEPLAANLVARLAAGNPGRAKKMLQQLTLSGISPVTEAEAQKILSAFGHTNEGPGGTWNPAVTDLMRLSGIEFEQLAVTLLRNLGFTAEMTKATGDGGIDIEAVLDRPLVGGRYLIQCKRFAPDTLVGSPTVREFYGALVADRRAVKGILITTSSFSAQAREFAANLPIELIDGHALVNLLTQTAKPAV
jgi:Holliday junction resolvasome RuvABC ATP-dependent DNA helicase subunit